jgi:hypothetical protein
MKGIQILVIFSLWAASAGAQVFPGDADNNGLVSHYDILPIGYAFGSVGPARLDTEMGGDSTLFEVAAYWEESFPGGQNYAHADTNGDGVVDFLDLLMVYLNYGWEHPGNFTNVIVEGTAGLDLPLHFEAPGLPSPLTAGSALEIPIFLGSEALPADSLHGIAFSIQYDADFFESVQLNLSNNWMNNEHLFAFEAPVIEVDEQGNATGILEVALTHFGKSHSSSGFGQIGTLSIIIEDVLVGLLPIRDSIGVNLSIEDVKLIDQDYNTHPVVWDSIELMVYHPKALAVSSDDELKDYKIDIFPNPFSGQLNIHASVPMQKLAIYSVLGEQVWSQPLDGQQKLVLSRRSFPTRGTYIVQVQTQKGIFRRKVLMLE